MERSWLMRRENSGLVGCPRLPSICGRRSRICTVGANSTICSTVRRWTMSCGRPTPGGKDLFVVVHREVHCACRLGRRSALSPWCAELPTRSWPFSVPVERCDAATRPGPLRRLAVRDAGTGVTVAHAAFERLPMV